MYKDNKIEEFLDVLSSTKSMPGGGTASALLSANATALALKVCNLTIGKERYKENENQVINAKKELENLKNEFLTLMDKDAFEFKAMEDVYKMPNNSDKEKEKRKASLENACKICCKIPKIVIEKSLEGLNLTDSLYGISNKSAESDLIIANGFFKAAIEGAWQNILINLKYIKDMKFIEEYDILKKEAFKKIS